MFLYDEIVTTPNYWDWHLAKFGEGTRPNGGMGSPLQKCCIIVGSDNLVVQIDLGSS